MVSGGCERIEANFQAYYRALVSDILRIVYSVFYAKSQDRTFNVTRLGTTACVI